MTAFPPMIDSSPREKISTSKERAMARYHVNPETQRPNICTATGKRGCKYAVDGQEPQHYATKEEAQAAIADQAKAENDTFTTMSKGRGSGGASESDPSVSRDHARSVDEKLAALYRQQLEHRQAMKQAEARIKHWEEKLQKSPHDKALSEVLMKDLGKYDAARERFNALAKEMEPLNGEFQESGGWNRAFLVTNKNGHVHRSMECSTTRATTEFEWLPAYSGVDENEIVDAAGEKACTECYPSAPVSSLSRPFSMERGGEKVEVFTPTGDPVLGENGKALKVPRGVGDFTESIKTEKQAYTKAMETVISRARNKAYFGDLSKTSPEGHQEYLENDVKMQERENLLVGALAKNHGVPSEQVRASIVQNAREKLRRAGSGISVE